MVKYCHGPGCNNRPPKIGGPQGLGFHEFPKIDWLKEYWLKAMHMVGYNLPKTARICSEHFLPQCFAIVFNKKRLRRGAVPTVFPDLDESLQEETEKLYLPLVEVTFDNQPGPNWDPDPKSTSAEMMALHENEQTALKNMRLDPLSLLEDEITDKEPLEEIVDLQIEVDQEQKDLGVNDESNLGKAIDDLLIKDWSGANNKTEGNLVSIKSYGEKVIIKPIEPAPKKFVPPLLKSTKKLELKKKRLAKAKLVMLDHTYILPDSKVLKDQLCLLRDGVDKLQKKLKHERYVNLKTKRKYDALKAKYDEQQSHLEKLKSVGKFDVALENWESKVPLQIVKKMAHMYKALQIHKKVGGTGKHPRITTWSDAEETKRFAMNLRQISLEAYNYVRDIFGYCLPHEHKVAQWVREEKFAKDPEYKKQYDAMIQDWKRKAELTRQAKRLGQPLPKRPVKSNKKTKSKASKVKKTKTQKETKEAPPSEVDLAVEAIKTASFANQPALSAEPMEFMANDGTSTMVYAEQVQTVGGQQVVQYDASQEFY